jgi:signal transduction histidine kinase
MESETTPAYIAQLEAKVQTLTRLLEVSSVLNSALLRAEVRIDTLLNYLMDAAAAITNSEAASVLLWNDKLQELYFAATTSVSQDLIDKPVPLDSIAGTIFRQKRVLEVNDVTSDPRHYNKVDEDNAFVTRSLLGVPMIASDQTGKQGKAIGVLEVVNKRDLPWTAADRDNMTLLANEAAVAIKVAQLMLHMQHANEELSELDKLKSDFIAIASHELRTPLGIILGYASFLQESDDEATRNHATKVMSSGLQLRRIIEDMINLRYLKQKPEHLSRHKTKLSNLIDDVQRDVLSLTDTDHELTIVCEDGETPLHIDSSRISMALVNVLNNAASFTPPGGKINLKARRQSKNEIWITITDTGIGIEPEKLERIFEEFYQIEDHMIRKHGGLGIGLSISRALVNAHGGRIWAESEGLEKGATFTIALPALR